jgi:hypothetical protein
MELFAVGIDKGFHGRRKISRERLLFLHRRPTQKPVKELVKIAPDVKEVLAGIFASQ